MIISALAAPAVEATVRPVKAATSKVPSLSCDTWTPRGLSSLRRVSENAVMAATEADSGAWKGGLREEMIEGVRTISLESWKERRSFRKS